MPANVETLPDTRAKILRAALAAFAARGYQVTSVREIAECVGVTKTAVLYHFPGKADILGALAEPMLNALDAAVAAAELADPSQSRWIAIEGILEVWLSHRYLLRVSMHDLALVTGRVFERFRDALLRANAIVAGVAPDLDDRVRAAQAIAMLADPVVLFADAPVSKLRAGVLRGVHALLGGKLPPSTKAQVRRTTRVPRGRPRLVDTERMEMVRRMIAAGSTAVEVAAQIGVSRATVYRYLASGALVG